MKTVLIFDQCYENPISFRVIDGDYSHLNDIYINHICSPQEKQDELFNLLYKNEEGDTNDDFLNEFPTDQIDANTKVIVVGYLS